MSKSLFSVTPDPLTGGGIFSALQSLDPPWVDEDIALQLDMSYYGNISGGKVVSPLIDRILTASKLSNADMDTLAGVIMAINKERWSREWATRSAEYDPIENYRMTEEMTDDETVTEYGRSHTRTDNLSHSETRTDNLTRTIDNQEVTTPNLTSTSQQATRGFNSNSDVNTDKETATNTGTNRVDTDGTEHNTGTQGTTGSNTGTQTDADTGSDTSTRNYTLTRSGNIGVTTSQQMLQSERDLWMWSYFYDVVFPDVDDVLTIPVYADCEDAEGTGGIIPTGTIAINANGEYDVTNYANANVAVPNTYTEADEGKVVDGGQLVSQTSGSIITNGTHNTLLLGSVDVNVPNTYTEADEGKVVSSGALVTQTGPLSITENGLVDTTTISSVNVALQPQPTYLANYDFTDSLTDSVNGFVATIKYATQSSAGITIDRSDGYCRLPNVFFPGLWMDLYFKNSTLGSTSHKRVVMLTSSTGLIFRDTGKWSFYNGGWATDSNITDYAYFDNHKMSIHIDKDNYWHIYRDDVLVYEPSVAGAYGGVITIGSDSQSTFNTTLESVKLHV